MIKKIKKFFTGIKLAFLDKKNFKRFIEDIDTEEKDPNSLFIRAGIVRNEKKDKLTLLFSIPENFVYQKDDRLINMKVNEMIQPITHYLSYTLGWAEYLYVPQVFHIEDDDPTSGESLTYAAVWQWVPIKSKYYLYKLFGITLGAIGLITALLIILL